MKTIRSLEGKAETVRELLNIPGVAESVTEWFKRDAIYYCYMAESDADDAAQHAILEALTTCREGEEGNPVRTLFRVRKWMRRTRYAGMENCTRATKTSQRRRGKKLEKPLAELSDSATLASGMTDNPVRIVAACEIAELLLMTAMGRHAKAIRSMSPEAIRSLVCPDMRGATEREPGEAPRVAENLGGSDPMPCQPGWMAELGLWRERNPEHSDSLAHQPTGHWEAIVIGPTRRAAIGDNE